MDVLRIECIKTMTLQHYDYDIPSALIAQEPLVKRSDARLLVVDRRTQSLQHRHIRDLPDFLRSQDCLVLNDTKVVPARLIGTRTRTGGRWEGLFLQHVPPDLWQIIGKTRGTMQLGETVSLCSPDGQSELLIELVAKNEDSTWIVKPRPFHRECNTAQSPEAGALLEQIGWTPIPPYIRGGKPLPYDQDRYQTVYAAHAG